MALPFDALRERPPARMDRGHALDGAPGAGGSPELPALIPITATAEDLESISPLVIKLVEQPVANHLSLPSHQRINTTYSLMASGAPDAIAATLRHTRDVISNYAPQQWRFAFAHM